MSETKHRSIFSDGVDGDETYLQNDTCFEGTLLHLGVILKVKALVDAVIKFHPHLVHVGDRDGRTPLFWALDEDTSAEYNNRMIRNDLCLAGANLNQRDTRGIRFLLYALCENRTQVVAELLKRGADPITAEDFAYMKKGSEALSS